MKDILAAANCTFENVVNFTSYLKSEKDWDSYINLQSKIIRGIFPMENIRQIQALLSRHLSDLRFCSKWTPLQPSNCLET